MTRASLFSRLKSYPKPGSRGHHRTGFRPHVEALEQRDLLSQGPFPFTIAGSQFLQYGVPVFLNGISYQPLEPGQNGAGEIRESRVHDDLRRWQAYQGGSDPVVLRVYAQPTAEFPVRMPKSFYNGVRELGFWIIRDIYFHPNYQAKNAIELGQAAVDAVIAEADATGGLDRVFAWEIGNEFLAGDDAQVVALERFVCAMAGHIRARMAEPGHEEYSNWVTWASWPPNDPLRTDGQPVVPRRDCLDFISYNAYSYDPERIRDQQAGPVTGTNYAGYLAGLKARYSNIPLVVSETGLPDSPSAMGQDQSSLPPLYPNYRRGGLTADQTAEGLADRYWDTRLSGATAGVILFEWNDEWHKVGEPWVHNDHPEEYFGIIGFLPDPIEARFKLQQEVIRDLFTMQFPSQTPILNGLTADNTTLDVTGETTVRAAVSKDALHPVRFRWESSRGYVTGDSDTVTFYAGGRALGPATVTVVAIDAAGRASRAALSISIRPPAAARIEILTLGISRPQERARASGRVANVDLTQFKAVAYIQTDQLYLQPFGDMKSIWIGPDGYWWTPITNAHQGELFVWLVPQAFDPPGSMPAGSRPPGFIAEARLATLNDTDNDLLADPWERTYFPDLTQHRYGDPDEDGANNLEEFLDATSPIVAGNNDDKDGLLDTWERRYFGRLVYGAGEDPDGDGLTNEREQLLGIHPGRTAVDRDEDGLPDTWELRWFGDLMQGADDDPDGDAYVNRDEYELGLSPWRNPGRPGGGSRHHPWTPELGQGIVHTSVRPWSDRPSKPRSVLLESDQKRHMAVCQEVNLHHFGPLAVERKESALSRAALTKVVFEGMLVKFLWTQWPIQEITPPPAH